MPYISPERRAELCVTFSEADTAGELNYCITALLVEYWACHTRNYQAINDIIGALESAKAEFQRRVVAPYESEKCKQNGDVYP